ncbi:unnamed protein product [Moneuplotes crassus]|uniref:Uncharacterized protein n=1 Tax=Euplotes crassus TaxID=5936 RepID=A0AAD1U5L2_EUPCR|nr:unnamed protein product [Moneuplotes crassus]
MEENKTTKGEGKGPKTTGRWKTHEHKLFVDCLKKYGKDWSKLEKSVPTRTSIQIRSHAQHYFDNIKKELSIENPIEYIMGKSQDDARLRSRKEDFISRPKYQNDSNIRDTLISQDNLVSHESQKRKRRNIEPSHYRYSEQGPQYSSKYFKDQYGAHRDVELPQESAYVYLDKDSVTVKAQQIEVNVSPIDLNSTFLRQREIDSIESNQQANFKVLPFSDDVNSSNYGHKPNEFTEKESFSQKHRAYSSYCAPLSPFQKILLEACGKVFCQCDNKFKIFECSSSKTKLSSNSTLIENGDSRGSFLSRPSEGISGKLQQSDFSKNSQPGYLEKDSQEYRG